jgi:prepilin-type N-terminal cleavage/methylation domain-containing protein
MLKNLLNKKRQEGFSIVEVMIVLAIAGLIILVVFLAVPALQRNSRNTTKKSDVGSIGSLVGEYQGANGGKSPAAISFTEGELTFTGGNSVKTAVSVGVSGVTIDTDGGTSVTAPTGDAVVIATKVKCSSSSTHTIVASARSVAILYNVETAGGTAPQCVDA